MRLTDWLIKNIGNDKILHFLVAAWIISMFSPLGWSAMAIAGGALLFLSVIKEIMMDEKPDWYDVLAAICGGACSALCYLVLTIWL